MKRNIIIIACTLVLFTLFAYTVGAFIEWNWAWLASATADVRTGFALFVSTFTAIIALGILTADAAD